MNYYYLLGARVFALAVFAATYPLLIVSKRINICSRQFHNININL
jgi:hypothetical protein